MPLLARYSPGHQLIPPRLSTHYRRHAWAVMISSYKTQATPTVYIYSRNAPDSQGLLPLLFDISLLVKLLRWLRYSGRISTPALCNHMGTCVFFRIGWNGKYLWTVSSQVCRIDPLHPIASSFRTLEWFYPYLLRHICMMKSSAG